MFLPLPPIQDRSLAVCLEPYVVLLYIAADVAAERACGGALLLLSLK